MTDEELLAALSRQQETQDQNILASLHGVDPNKSQFSKGLAAGVDSLQGIGYGALGFVGDVIGSDTIRNIGARGMQRNQFEASLNAPRIREAGEIESAGDLGSYIAYNTGQLLPSVAESLGAAALGGVTGGPVGAGLGFVGKSIVKKTLQDKLSDEVKEKALRAAGATALNAYGTGVGDIYQETSQGGTVDPNAGLAAAGAVPYAALEYLGDINLARMVGIVDSGKEISKSLMRTSITKGAQQVGIETGTEMGQEALLTGAAEMQDPASMTLDRAIDRIIETGFATAAGTLLPGLGGGAIHHYQNRAQPAAEQPAAEQPAAEQPAVEPPAPPSPEFMQGLPEVPVSTYAAPLNEQFDVGQLPPTTSIEEEAAALPKVKLEDVIGSSDTVSNKEKAEFKGLARWINNRIDKVGDMTPAERYEYEARLRKFYDIGVRAGVLAPQLQRESSAVVPTEPGLGFAPDFALEPGPASANTYTTPSVDTGIDFTPAGQGVLQFAPAAPEPAAPPVPGSMAAKLLEAQRQRDIEAAYAQIDQAQRVPAAPSESEQRKAYFSNLAGSLRSIADAGGVSVPAAFVTKLREIVSTGTQQEHAAELRAYAGRTRSPDVSALATKLADTIAPAPVVEQQAAPVPISKPEVTPETKAAEKAAWEAKKAADAAAREEKRNAVQERSTAQAPVQPETATGKGMGRQVRDTKKPAEKAGNAQTKQEQAVEKKAAAKAETKQEKTKAANQVKKDLKAVQKEISAEDNLAERVLSDEEVLAEADEADSIVAGIEESRGQRLVDFVASAVEFERTAKTPEVKARVTEALDLIDPAIYRKGKEIASARLAKDQARDEASAQVEAYQAATVEDRANAKNRAQRRAAGEKALMQEAKEADQRDAEAEDDFYVTSGDKAGRKTTGEILMESKDKAEAAIGKALKAGNFQQAHEIVGLLMGVSHPNLPLFKIMMTGDTKATLEWIAENSPVAIIRRVARTLSDLNVLPQIVLQDMVGGAGGKYAAGADIVTLNAGLMLSADMRDVTRMITHEVIHAATIRNLSIGGKAADNIKKLYEFLQTEGHADLLKQYGMTNEIEFVAEVLTNGNFIRELRDIKVPESVLGGSRGKLQSAWLALVKGLKYLLGINVPDSALAHAIENAVALMEDRGSNVKALETMIRTGGKFNKLNYAFADGLRDIKNRGLRDFNPESFVTSEGVMDKFQAQFGDRAVELASARTTAEGVTMKEVLGWQTFNHIIKTYSSKLNGLAKLKKASDQRTADISEAAREAGDLDRQYSEWAKSEAGRKKVTIDGKSQTQTYNIGALMGETTLEGILPSDDMQIEKHPDYEANKDDAQWVASYNRIKERWAKLDPAGRAVYTKAHKLHEKMFEQIVEAKTLSILRTLPNRAYRDAMEAQIAATGKRPTMDEMRADLTAEYEGTGKGRKMIKEAKAGKEAREQFDGMMREYGKQSKPYFHVGRFGDYFARVIKHPADGYSVFVTEDGKKSVVKSFPSTVEGRDAAQKLADSLRDEGRDVSSNISAAKTEHFERFETMGQMTTQDQELRTLFPESEGFQVVSGMLSSDEAFTGTATARFLADMLQRIDGYQNMTQEDKAAAKNMIRQLYVQTLPETSSRRVFQHRQGIKGWRPDEMWRSQARRLEIATRQLGYSLHDIDIQKALESLRSDIASLQNTNPKEAAMMQQVVDELAIRERQIRSSPDTPVIDLINNMSFTMYLAASPAYTAINLLQPTVVTLPVLGGKYGFVKSVKALVYGTGLAIKIIRELMGQNLFRPELNLAEMKNGKYVNFKFLSEDDRKALQEMVAAGKIDLTQAHEIGHVARDRNAVHGPLANARHVLGMFMHYSELMNRVATGMAAYKLASASPNTIKDMAPIDVAKDMIDQTQYSYELSNRPRRMGKEGVFGKFSPLVFQFQMYNVQTIELLVREFRKAFMGSAMTDAEKTAARKTLAGMFGTTSVVAGTLGAPAATAVAALVNAIASEDDEPYDAVQAYRQWLYDVTGSKEIAEMVAHGMFRPTLGIDMSRAGMQNLVPFSRFMADRREWKDAKESLALDLMGPSMGWIGNMFEGYDRMADGDFAAGAAMMLPRFAADIIKGVTVAENGWIYDNFGNKVPLDPTSADVAKVALGFRPAQLAEQREAVYAENTRKMLIGKRKTSLKKAIYKAMDSGDQEGVMEGWRAVDEYNAVNPSDMLTRQDVYKGYRQREREYQGGLKVVVPSTGKEARKIGDRYEYLNI